MMRFTILGCGSSGGVPRIGGIWGDCDPKNPRNRRRRCSLLVERIEETRVTRVLIDTSPDLRDQLLDAGIATLDGVVFTHSHADHVHGIDDLRAVVINNAARLPVWSDPATTDALISRFGYAFVAAPDSLYPPILDLCGIDGTFDVPGPAGPITFQPLKVDHGSMDALGFRIGDFVYMPDVVRIPDATWAALQGTKCWVIDALRRKPHPTHAHLDLTLEWIAKIAPETAVITNMHIDLDYATLCRELPTGVIPAYDGLVLTR